MLGKSLVRMLVVSSWLAACADRVDHDEGGDGTFDDLEGHSCAWFGKQHPCSADGSSMQYCIGDDELDEDLAWGVCMSESERECDVTKTRNCDPGGFPDAGGSQECELVDGEPTWSDCMPYPTPLVVVLPGTALAFEPAGTATFTITDGCMTEDWPTSPWLAIDLDRSGSIDGGHELFGSGTVLTNGRLAEHGFAALAELDADRDGAVTRADPGFTELLLWRDHDRDRRSTHWEHELLAVHGITAIPTEFTRHAECDARNNCAVERATIALGHARAAEVVDVHLPCQ
jgi:hypothetical protein